jgi:uncharacterized membrane protein YedE/YeeE
MDTTQEEAFWDPYWAGFLLGLVVLASFLFLGHGIGASGASSRLGVTVTNALAPGHVQSNAYFSRYFLTGHPMNDWLVFEVIGVFLGGLLSSVLARRNKLEVLKGPNIQIRTRLFLALSGGILMGFAARLARGCTSGQALCGGALQSVGSWIFMLCVFAGGYALAVFFRRQWL